MMKIANYQVTPLKTTQYFKNKQYSKQARKLILMQKDKEKNKTKNKQCILYVLMMFKGLRLAWVSLSHFVQYPLDQSFCSLYFCFVLVPILMCPIKLKNKLGKAFSLFKSLDESTKRHAESTEHESSTLSRSNPEKHLFE